ncbi:MAG: bifunctional phosphopantothenoylcysteine decarboxylase/phosphopantothenate--cysteine ligase CoaBC [Gemmatimonadales bacterium]
MWSGRHVVVGVSGGIASYKSCILVRRLAEAGARVDVILTEGAAEFVRPLTFEALSGRPVLTSLWTRDAALQHVRLAQAPDLILIAPATAHLLARVAQGLGDDLLTTLLLARTSPVLFAPAMNDAMYANPATQANLATLARTGAAFVGPEVGALAEGPSDRPGRMSEPEVILAHAARLLRVPGPLTGKRVVITAGPTREAIDPVRVVTNRSSGRMGYRLAEAAWERGAEVTLISGPADLPAPVGAQLVKVESTAQMERAVREALPAADVLVMAAAPADYRPADPSATKRPRQDGAASIVMEPTADILAATETARKPGAVIVGFALETGNAVEKGKAKLARKKLDLIVVNDALEPGAGFEVDTNRVVIVGREGGTTEVPLASKRAVAESILDAVEARLVR